MRTRLSSRARPIVVATAIVLPALVLSPTPAFAAPQNGIVASGDEWSITTAPGGYLVTYELDEALPIVSDAPTLVVDGKTVGLAIESADGLSLSALTTDPAVRSARTVEKGWASSDGDKAAEGGLTEVTDEEVNDALESQLRRLAAPEATEDPSDLGSYAVTEAEYDFGDRSVALAGISGIRGEMTGKMYLTDAPGERPTVILLHGRHGSCATGTANPLRWPCGPDQVNVRSYQGYEGTGRALASHGYNVLSIAANAVNSNDNQLALDYGAQARGQLILDTLGMLEKANDGKPVVFDDISWPNAEGSSTKTTRTLDQALTYATARTDAPATAAGVTAASLAGRFDLDRVGVMGHSRGGEGATSAATLNQGLEDPYGIISVLPLAPVDFGRMTVPDVSLGVFLPYCDGDVSNQQGQHMIDDSRHAFGDDVMRSAVWVMGANHNFFNTVWTPGLYPYSTSDDWNRNDTTSSCSTRDASRLTPAQQYQVGVSYMTGFFRLTMGGETQFQTLFDGSTKPTTTATTFADVRVMASQPTTATTLVTDFAERSTLVRTAGSASAQVCANAETATSIAPTVPYCTTREIGTARVPHWTPVRFGLNVPATPVTRVTWTGSATDPAAASTGELRVSVPAAQRDVSSRSQLTVKTAPDRTVPTGTDFTISVIDGAGNTFSRAASAIDPLAINRMPGGTNTTLNKFVLQQLTIPTAEMTGIDLTDVREIRFTAGVGADGTGAGGVYLSDLAFDTPTPGNAVAQQRTTVNVASTSVEEGNGPSTADVAVYLDAPAETSVSGWVSVVGASTVASAVQKVSFAPGEICQAITVPVNGDTSPYPAGAMGITVSVTNTTNAVMGSDAFGRLVVREDDGLRPLADRETLPVGAISAGAEVPTVGVQGDACAELAAAGEPGELTASSTEVAPGDSLTLTATGYRSGESVEFGFGDLALDPIVANADGVAVATIEVDEESELGPQDAFAVGAGSGRVQETSVAVLAPTETTLAVDAGSELVAGAPLTLVATVTGAETEGVVTFTEGAAPTARADVAAGTVLGTAEVVDGVATLTIEGGLPEGDHAIVATFGRTDVASASSSAALVVTIAAAPVDGGGEPTPTPTPTPTSTPTSTPTPGSTTTPLPAGTGTTGGQTGALAATGVAGIGSLALLAAGALGVGLVLAIRRRRAVDSES
ncbi:Ig-like domain-containing protein [Microbacterium sp. Gd 4-13]|uniref:Ig-like domain-containing protein n=1 Tax=Microbacterium sp. Gd 4-13 TaxID=2173179 RepID=UPI00197B3E68|nr:Ig-like domain-containing protein [Microbacterium sp. Gd 4-13]